MVFAALSLRSKSKGGRASRFCALSARSKTTIGFPATGRFSGRMFHARKRWLTVKAFSRSTLRDWETGNLRRSFRWLTQGLAKRFFCLTGLVSRYRVMVSETAIRYRDERSSSPAREIHRRSAARNPSGVRSDDQPFPSLLGLITRDVARVTVCVPDRQDAGTWCSDEW